MKKLFLGVMMVALIITSCNKYANDFQALKDQIAALATQVTGVTTLENTIASQTATIAALQTAIAALPTTGSIASQFTALAGQLTTIQGNINSISSTLSGVATTGTANAAALATLQTTLNGVITAKTAADAALNATLATLQSTLATDIAAGTTANAAAIAAAQTAILSQITASSMSTDANVNAKIAAAQTALTTLINSGLAATNANVNTQVSAAQAALTTLIDTQLAAVQAAVQQSIADGTSATNAHTDAQIAALTAVLNAGLVGVNGNIAGVSQQVTDAQAAILALVTSTSGTINSNLAAAQLALSNLVTSTATATQSSINGNISALQTALTILINTGNAATIAQIQATQAAIVGGVGDTATSLTIHGLQLALGQAQAEIATLLAASAMYNGDVTIQSDADVDFYFGKINQMGIINGNLSITTHGSTPVTELTKLNTILGNIVAVIGVNSSTYSISTTNFFFGIVTSVTLNVTPGTGHWVWVSDMAGDNLVMKNLTSVRGDYTVMGADIDDSGLTQVGGTYTLNYPGKYEGTILASVGGNVILVDQPSNGTGFINFPVLTVDPAHFVGNGLPGGPGAPTVPTTTTVVFNSTNTTWVNFGLATGAQIQNLTANSALTVTLGTITPNALTITANVANTITLAAVNPNGVTINDASVGLSTINMAAATSSTGAITVNLAPVTLTGGAGSTVDLSNLATSTGNISATMWDGTHANAGVVKLDAFNSGVTVAINGLQTIANLGSWYGTAGSWLTAPQALTVTLPHYQWLAGTVPAVGDLAAVQTLNLGGAADVVTLTTYPTLLAANIHGTVMQAGSPDATHFASVTANVVSSNVNLQTLVLSGLINTATLTGNTSLTSLTTSDVVNSLTLSGATAITGVSLGHNAFVGAIGFGGPGSTLIVTGNTHLTSLVPTALDWMNTLTVTGNTNLTHFDFSSYHTDIYSGALVAINIDATKDMGTYSFAVAPVSAGNPGIQAQIHSADIMTLKSYIIQMSNDAHITSTTFNINIGIPVATTLTADLNVDNYAFGFAYTNNVQGGGPLHTLSQLGQVSL